MVSSKGQLVQQALAVDGLDLICMLEQLVSVISEPVTQHVVAYQALAVNDPILLCQPLLSHVCLSIGLLSTKLVLCEWLCLTMQPHGEVQ